MTTAKITLDNLFEDSFYLEGIKRGAQFGRIEKIYCFAKKHLQFSYGDLNYRTFREHYSADGWWIIRKFTCLIQGFIAAVIKPIWHLIQAIFLGLGVCFRRVGRERFRAKCFYIARDFQEAFGHAATLFSDSYGQYHIQASGFHKSCYDCFVKDHGIDVQIFVEEGELEEALRAVGELDSFEKDNWFVQIAKKYLKQGKLDQALSTAKKIVRQRYSASEIFEAIGKAYLAAGQPDQALSAVEELDSFKKDNGFVQIAEKYLEQGKLDQALSTAKKIVRQRYSASEIFEAIGEAYLAAGQPDQALSAFEGVSSSEKNRFLPRIARKYLERGERDKAFEIAEGLERIGMWARDCVLLKEIGEAYLAAGELGKTVKVANKLDFTEKDALLFEVSIKYFRAGRLTEALSITLDASFKFRLFEEIAEAYLANGDLNNAFRFAQQMSFGDAKDKLLDSIARGYINGKNYEDASKVIDEIFSYSLKQRLEELLRRSRGGPSYSYAGGGSWSGFFKFSTPPPPLQQDQDYAILGLQAGAGKDAIRKAYRKIALKDHPDKVSQQEGETDAAFEARKAAAEERFRQATEAYERLLERLLATA